MSDNFLFGSPVLFGSATTPGVPIPEELNKHIPTIFKACKDFGLDFYPTIVQMLSHDEMSEVASYGGFASRYPHWKFGAEYEEMQRGYLYGNHRIYEMVVNCLNPETRIATNRGTILASDIKSGDVVFGQKGPREVAKVVTCKKSKTYTIKLKNQIRTINCTGQHKWLCVEKEGYEWVETKNIKKESIIVGCDIYDFHQNNPCNLESICKNVFEKNNIKKCKNVKLPEKMTLELAELIGIILGDGCLGQAKKTSVQIAIGKDNYEYLLHVKKLCKLIFDVDAKVYADESAYKVCIHSKIISDYLCDLGLNYSDRHDNKKIPWSIYESSNEYKAACLRGLFDTDGHCSDDLKFSSTSLQLVKDMQLFLSEFGIYSTAKKIDNSNKNIKDIYLLVVRGRNSQKKFHSRIGFSIKYKMENLEIICYKMMRKSCGGIKNLFIQDQIVKNSKNISYKLNRSLYRSILNLKKRNVGMNTLIDFCESAKLHGLNDFIFLNEYLNIPYYEVESVSDSQDSETIDIALYHNDHDFVAEGLISHNTNPSYLYCLNSNTLLDNITVIAHALGHVHFFKNNIHFSRTNTNAHNELANNGSNIRKYISRYGNEEVGEFMDMLMRVETLVDTSNIWKDRIAKDVVITDKKEYKFPKRIITNHDYMEDWVNTKEFIDGQNKKIQSDEIVKDLGILSHPETDIFGYIKNHAPLKPWQRDIAEMLYNEAIYFSPQGKTKTGNEGFASWTDYNIMAKQGYCGLGQENYDDGIVEYAIHKAGVLGGKYSTNPYKLGFTLLTDIEDRWNKGKFGTEYEECRDELRKENWDENLNLGKQKVFDVCKNYDDYQLINEFFTKDFCEKYEFFEYKKHPNGEIKIESRDHKKIKKGLLKKHINRGLPIIKLLAPRLKGKIFFMEHQWDGLEIYKPYATEVIRSIAWLCKSSVALQTKNQNSEDIVYYLNADIGYFLDIDVKVMTKAQFLKI